MTGSFPARHPRLARTVAVAVAAVAALLVAVWIAPRASGAAAAWIRTPPVRLHTVTAPDGGVVRVAGASGRAVAAPATLDAGMRFTMAGVVCDVPSGDGAVTIRLRTSLDGVAWSHWMEAPLEVADDHGSPTAYVDALWTGEARYVQVTAATGDRRGPIALSHVRVAAIDPAEQADVAARLTGAVRHVAAAIAGLGDVPIAVAGVSSPGIVSRAQWGADESLRSGAPSYSPVKMAFVHHTASGNAYAPADVPAIMRGMLAYHTQSLGWSDIGYNFVIDRFGTIYEGRYGGVDRGVVGAQVMGFNTGSTGVSLLGTFTDETPPPEMIAALERLLAWKLSLSGLDPNGTARLTCGVTQKFTKGEAVTFPVIAGHRDANYTECPGQSMYALLPSVRAAVAGTVSEPVVAALGASTGLVSPNGDGVLDSVTVTVQLNVEATWRLALRDAAGTTLRTWSGYGTGGPVTWDGSAGGRRVADGSYTLRLCASTPTSKAVPVAKTVTVDTVAPRLAEASASRPTFSPNGDAQSETVAVTYRPAEPCDVRVGIVDASGEILRWLQDWRSRPASSCTIRWDGRIVSADTLVPAPDGKYRMRVERRDAAGNLGRRGIALTLDRTLGFPTAAPATFSPNGDRVKDTTKLGFTITRRAVVTLELRSGTTVVRTLSLGTLDAGAHTATWNGKKSTGAYVASGKVAAKVVAASTLGETSVVKAVVVDRYAPRVYPAGGRTTTVGTSNRLGYKIADPFSPQTDVSYVITDAKGRRVASGHPGWVATALSLSITWRPASRGVFTVTYRATDVAGNHEAAPGSTKVTVK